MHILVIFNVQVVLYVGMTRAVKSLLILDFKKAFEFNNMVWIFCIAIPIITIDIVMILKKKYKKL